MRKSSSALFIAVLTTLSLSAHGQFQVNNGNAADANPRAGAYGSNNYQNSYNDRPINSATVNGNQIVTGNVTGGRSLQTNPGYFAPGQLETTTGSEQMQNFIRDSVGVPAPYQQNTPGYAAPQAFYGGQTTAAAPPGFTRDQTTGAYVPSAPVQAQTGNDTRVGLINPGGVPPSATGLPSSVGPAVPMADIPGLQLFGPRSDFANSEVDTTAPFTAAYRQWTPQDMQQMGQSSVQQMRAELVNGNNFPATQPGAMSSTYTPPGVTPGAVTPQAISSGPLNTQINPTLSSQVATNTNPSAQQPQANPATISPAQQSSEYAQLQERFNQFQKTQPETSANPSTPGGLTENNNSNTSSANAANSATGANTAEDIARKRAELYPPSVPQMSTSPLVIHSLAVGIHATGLRDLMADAEQRMHQGHYSEALIRYATAAEVAPNNPLIFLGRSFAELGAGYYARAARDLQSAVIADQTLLMGQYDLKAFLGEDRLSFLVRDLKQIANDDKQNADAPFLLAYIAYNTGSKNMAAGYLDLAEQRSKEKSPAFNLMQQDWQLPAANSKK